MKNAYRYLGLVALVSSILIYISLSYIYNKYRGVLDEPMAYIHSSVASSIHEGCTGGLGEFVSRAPSFTTIVLGYANLPLQSWTIAMGVLTIISIFMLTYVVSRDTVKSGLASLLLSATPCFIYWFKLNNYGAYTLLPLWVVLLVVLAKIKDKSKNLLFIIIALLNSILWLSWSMGWFTLITYSVYVALSFLYGTLKKRDIVLGLILLLTSIPLNIATPFKYVTVYHVASFSTLALTLFLTQPFTVKTITGFTAKLLIVLIPFTAGSSIALLVSNYTSLPGVSETYVKIHYAIYDYGLLGLLAIPVIIYVLRNKIIKPDENGVHITAMIILFVASIITSFYIPTFALIAAVSIVPLIAWGLIDSSIYILSILKLGSFSKTLITLAIIALIVASNTLHSFIVVTMPPSPVRLDLPEIYHKEITASESALLKALDVLKNNISGRRALIISYWGYSYFIEGYLGDLVEPYAYPWDSGRKKIVSQILLSSDEKAYSMIKRVAGSENVSEAYILVAELVSFTGSYNESKSVDLGMVVEIARESYHVYGDIDRVFLYIQEAGFDRDSYIDPMFVYPSDPALSWKDAMLGSILVKMIVHGLERLNYTVFNQGDADLTDRPLRVKLEKDLYEFVGSVIVPMIRIERTPYPGYVVVKEICYYIAIYRVSLS